jgi:tRNA (Thr-GGU) A37 N-methylase
MEMLLHTIGISHTSFTDKSETPIQASLSEAKGVVEIYLKYAQDLQDLEGFSYILLLYTFNDSSGYSLLVKLFLDDHLHGLFATRYPAPSNLIGLSPVRLIARQCNTLEKLGWTC